MCPGSYNITIWEARLKAKLKPRGESSQEKHKERELEPWLHLIWSPLCFRSFYLQEPINKYLLLFKQWVFYFLILHTLSYIKIKPVQKYM